jgi:drug/metabolite transporter (DMT)-like permease
MPGSAFFAAWALASAACAGSADYLAAHAARRVSALRVSAWAQGVGVSLIVAVGLVMGWPALAADDLALAAVAGLLVAVGLAALYRALAIGPIGVTAPLSAVLGAALPVLYSLATGRTLQLAEGAGLLAGLVAVVLLASASGASGQGARRAGILAASVAGLCLGGYVLCLNATREASGLWPLLVSRSVATTLLFALLLLRAKRHPEDAGMPWPRVLAAGLLDSLGMLLYLAALRSGQLAEVAVIGALYPSFTVALAVMFDGERFRAHHAFGVAFAVLAVVLFSLPPAAPA